MKNQIAKLVVFMCSVLLLKNEVKAHNNEMIHLRGKPLFSFTQDHFIVETDKAYYKIAKKGLPSSLLSKLEKSVISNKEIEFEIAQNKIDYSWPVSEPIETIAQLVPQNETLSLQSDSNNKDGQMTLSGNLVNSFIDDEFLVQTQDTIYELKKSDLSKDQINELAQIKPGGRVHLSIPQTAVHHSWGFKPQASRTVASIEEPDTTLKNKTYMELTGTILYSANPETVAVQSKNSIYHLKRQSIVTEKPSLLDSYSSKVKLIIPTRDVEFTWTAKNSKNEESK